MSLPPLEHDLAARRILDTRAAAAFLGMKPDALRRMIADGIAPPHIRLGVRRWGFRFSDLAAWGGVKRDGSAA